MKNLFIKSGVSFSTAVLLSMFFGGVLWTIVPLGGITMPHWIETAIGIPFTWSAMLASILLGLICVCSIGISLLDADGMEGE
jgi:hypothetical protein